MISFTTGRNLFGTLSQNSSTANLALYDQLSNIEHRYLLQKYFNNEGSFTINTIGAVDLNVVSALAVGATSATLTVAWAYQSTTAYLTFSDGENVLASFVNGSTAVTWQAPLIGTQYELTNDVAIGDTSATLENAWASTSAARLTNFSSGEQKTVTYTKGSTAITWSGGLAGAASNFVNTSTIAANSAASIGGVQFYNLPPNYSKLKDVTITVGVLKWTLSEIKTREDWDKQNVFPYYADIPQSYFIYPSGDHGAQMGIWPIPSTTGNQITFNYKFRIPDLSLADYTTGTVSVSNGGITVTGSGTAWTPTTNRQLESRWIQIAQTAGDNLWYQVASVESNTSLTLFQPYQGITVAGGAYTLGQMPLLQEDFQDMLVWKALTYYYSSIIKDPGQSKDYEEKYQVKLRLLAEYSGSTTINVNLSPRGIGRNPNLYPYKLDG